MQKIRNAVEMILFAVILFLIIQGYNKMIDLHEMYLVEKAEHDVDGMTVMQGKYQENGLILTEDGNEWIYMWDEPKPVDTEVTVIFQTDYKPKKEWKIVTVQ